MTLIASISFVLVTALSILADAHYSSMKVKEKIQRLDFIEGYYSAEMAAWSGLRQIKSAEKLKGNYHDWSAALPRESGASHPTVSFANNYDTSLLGSESGTYGIDPGSQVPGAITKEIDANKSQIRRYFAGAVGFILPQVSVSSPGAFPIGENSICGWAKFSNAQIKSCLAVDVEDTGSACIAGGPGGIIDFELLPDGSTPSEWLPIRDQYLASHGIRFCEEDASGTCTNSPLIAETGPNDAVSFGLAFPCQTCIVPNARDTVHPGENVGKFFLTRSVGLYPYRVYYSSPVGQASADILDIDFGDEWTIEARGLNDEVLETMIITGPSGASTDVNHPYRYWRDGRATRWAFQRPQNDIYSIRLSGRQLMSPENPPAFALDNFSHSKVCEKQVKNVRTMKVEQNLIGSYFDGAGRYWLNVRNGEIRYENCNNTNPSNAPTDNLSSCSASGFALGSPFRRGPPEAHIYLEIEFSDGSFEYGKYFVWASAENDTEYPFHAAWYTCKKQNDGLTCSTTPVSQLVGHDAKKYLGSNRVFLPGDWSEVSTGNPKLGNPSSGHHRNGTGSSLCVDASHNQLDPDCAVRAFFQDGLVGWSRAPLGSKANDWIGFEVDDSPLNLTGGERFTIDFQLVSN